MKKEKISVGRAPVIPAGPKGSGSSGNGTGLGAGDYTVDMFAEVPEYGLPVCESNGCNACFDGLCSASSQGR